jgi:hypothetical protein
VSETVDIYAYWRARLVAPKPDESQVALMLPTIGAPIAGENPQCGLWKVRLRKDAGPVLMQIWLANGDGKPAAVWAEGLALQGVLVPNPERTLPQTPEELADRWLFAQPATKDEALFWRKEGRWPSDAPPLPPRTHNQPADPYEALKADVDDRLEQVKEWLTVNSPIGDQTTCDMARNMQSELLDLKKRGDAMHGAEKAPVLEQGRAVDARYRFRDALTDWAGRLRDVFEQFMRAEERRQQEARDRAYREQLAAAEAERARIEAERAEKLKDDPAAALTDPEPELPPLPPPPEPVKVQSGGGRGRKVGLKDDWDIAITDYKLAALQVIEDPDISIMVGKVLLRRVRAAKGKIEIPGVKISKVRKAA